MWKKIAKIVSMGSLAGLIIAKLRGVRINPPALRLLLLILVAMAFFVDSPTVVMIAGTWLIFLLIADVARLAGINLSLFLPAEKEKKEEKDKNSQVFRLTKKTAEVQKTTEPVKSVSVSEAKEDKNGIFSKIIGAEKKGPAEAKTVVETEPAVPSADTSVNKSPLDFIPGWMRLDKKVASVLFGSAKNDEGSRDDLALFRKN